MRIDGTEPEFVCQSYMRRLVIATLVLTSPAYADDPPQFPLMTAHARLDGTIAKITARYALDVDVGFEAISDELAIPAHGIVTGAVVTVDGTVHRMALDPAEQAAAKLDELGDRPGGDQREWAMDLSVSGLDGNVHVQLAAPHPARVLVDLEIAAPTCFFRDVRYALVPKTWQPIFGASFAPRDASAVDAGCEGSSSETAWLAFPSGELAAMPFGDQRIGTLGSRLPLDDQDIASVELDLAREISRVPADLYTAFVIDGSRSVGDSQRAAQRAIIAAYVRAAPQSRVQIIEYDRDPHALLPSWTTAPQVMTSVERQLDAMTGRNGSNLDRGLAEAATWLARVSGTRRIVLFTDDLMAQRLESLPPASLRVGLPEGTLVQVVKLSDDTGTLDRDDDALLAPLADATEGMAVFGRLDGDGHVDALKLVRPIELEQIAITAPGWTLHASPTNDACPFDDHGDLLEGSSCSWWGLGAASSGPVRIEGLVWGHHFVRVVRPDPSQGRSLARVVSAFRGFEDDLMHQIDRAALAVNQVWSLFGTWGGHDGYADLGRVSSGWGSGGCCSTGDVGMIGRSGSNVSISMANVDLKTQLASELDQCSIGEAHFDVNLELTVEEIVDVSVVMRTGSPALHDCIEDAVWNTLLTLPSASPHLTTQIAF